MRKVGVIRGAMAAVAVAAGVGAMLSGAPQSQAPAGIDAGIVSGALHWRMAGPFRAGRVNAVTGVPGALETFYFGSVGGGVWKTENAGRTWSPIFDSTGTGSIGAIAVAPSNPSIVYVGTGEADMRDSIAYGDGMYKSTDAGKTWTHIGLEPTRQIGRVAVDPRDPNVVFVAALGHVYGPSPDRGVYRSRDGGATWQKVLYKDDRSGAIDVVFDPSNPDTVYAALWAVQRPPWFIYAPANLPGSGVYKSTDGGTNWTQLTNGLPSDGLGRMGIGISPANPQCVYVIADAKEGGLFRSEDAGATFRKVSGDQRIWQRGWYFEKIAVDPKNADIVYVPNTGLYKSTDGGHTWGAPIKASPGGDDYQGLWISPDESTRMILASDQGSVVTVDGAKTWSSWYNQPTAQMYHIAADFRFPYWLTGAQQDSGAVGVPERTTNHAVISMHEWTGLCAGGESGYTAPDPKHPYILFGGTVEKCDVRTGATANVSPEKPQPGVTYRHDWTQPLVFSTADPTALYFANQFVYKTIDGGKTWKQISQDLTREDPGVPSLLHPAAAADAPADTRRGVVYTIAPSPLRAPLLWVGTDDGLVYTTPNDGGTWNNVTPPGMTSWTKVVMIDASHFDPNEAFVAAERHQLEDYEPHIWRTKDSGKTWQTITRGLPAGVYVQTVKEDPVRRGLLYCGTERGVFVSFDDGDSWQSLQLNLPPVSMRDLQAKGDDLIVATHGRGFWVLDDISMLRQLDAKMLSSNAYLFAPAPAVMTPVPNEQGTPLPKDEPAAENPPYGAPIDYYINAQASGPVTIEVLNAAGTVIRRVSSDDQAVTPDPNSLQIQTVWAQGTTPISSQRGVHRWVWDFRPNPPASGRGRGGRGGGGGGRGRGAALPTGNYTVRLTVNGQAYSQPLTVKPDPRGGV